MTNMGAFQAKTHFSALLEKVEQGGEVIITKHGHPVAQLIPFSQKNQAQTLRAIQQLKKFSKKHQLRGLDWKTLRDEGRR